jgi:hypothetical protein
MNSPRDSLELLRAAWMIQAGFVRKWIFSFQTPNPGTKWTRQFRNTNFIPRNELPRHGPASAGATGRHGEEQACVEQITKMGSLRILANLSGDSPMAVHACFSDCLEKRGWHRRPQRSLRILSLRDLRDLLCKVLLISLFFALSPCRSRVRGTVSW